MPTYMDIHTFVYDSSHKHKDIAVSMVRMYVQMYGCIT